MNIDKLKILFSIPLLIAIASCSTSQKRTSTESYQNETLQIARSSTSPDAKDYQKIDRSFREKRVQDTLKLSEKFLKTYKQSKFRSDVYQFRALTFMSQKQYALAIPELKKSIEVSLQNEDDHMSLMEISRFNLALSYFELGQPELSLNNLNDINMDQLADAHKGKVLILRSKILRSNQDFFRSTLSALEALEFMKSTNNNSLIQYIAEGLDVVQNKPEGTKLLEKLYSRFENSPAADQIIFRIAQSYLSQGNSESAKRYFKLLVDGHPNSSFATVSRDNLRISQNTSIVDSTKVGVILTLSGKYASMGHRALQGLELALKIYNPNAFSNLSLVIFDDKGEQEKAEAAFDQLYFQHHVAAIVGPISSRLLDPLSKKAELYGVPLITLTQKEIPHDAQSKSYTISAGLTPSLQAHELIRFARGKLGIADFAILAPSSKFGEEYTKVFWDEVENSNGSIRGFESYPDTETDFRSVIDKLTGLNAYDARSKEVTDLQTLKTMASGKLKMKSKRYDQFFKLKPIIDFQAVFIPDEPKLLGQILPTFAYRDVEHVTFLGINTWNSPDLISRAARFAEGSVFVDGFFSKSNKSSVQKYTDEYRKTFMQEPSLIDSYAYDVGSILEQTLGKSNLTRDEFYFYLTHLSDFPGVSGPINYVDGHFLKTLHFLTLKTGKIDEIAF